MRLEVCARLEHSPKLAGERGGHEGVDTQRHILQSQEQWRPNAGWQLRRSAATAAPWKEGAAVRAYQLAYTQRHPVASPTGSVHPGGRRVNGTLGRPKSGLYAGLCERQRWRRRR